MIIHRPKVLPNPLILRKGLNVLTPTKISNQIDIDEKYEAYDKKFNSNTLKTFV